MSNDVKHESPCVMKDRVETLERKIERVITRQEVTDTKFDQVKDTLADIKDMIKGLQEKRETDNYSNKEVTDLVLKYVVIFVMLLGLFGTLVGYLF